jgi:hypothetical protein
MAKMLVEVEISDISAQDLMKEIEGNKKEWFPVGENMVSVNQYYMKLSPEQGSFLFKLRGIIDEED